MNHLKMYEINNMVVLSGIIYVNAPAYSKQMTNLVFCKEIPSSTQQILIF